MKITTYTDLSSLVTDVLADESRQRFHLTQPLRELPRHTPEEIIRIVMDHPGFYPEESRSIPKLEQQISLAFSLIAVSEYLGAMDIKNNEFVNVAAPEGFVDAVMNVSSKVFYGFDSLIYNQAEIAQVFKIIRENVDAFNPHNLQYIYESIFNRAVRIELKHAEARCMLVALLVTMVNHSHLFDALLTDLRILREEQEALRALALNTDFVEQLSAMTLTENQAEILENIKDGHNTKAILMTLHHRNTQRVGRDLNALVTKGYIRLDNPPPATSKENTAYIVATVPQLKNHFLTTIAD